MVRLRSIKVTVRLVGLLASAWPTPPFKTTEAPEAVLLLICSRLTAGSPAGPVTVAVNFPPVAAAARFDEEVTFSFTK